MNPNIFYNAVTAGGLLAMFATEGVKSICAAFGRTIKGRASLVTFIVVWTVMVSYPWHPVEPNADPNTGNKLYYLIHSLLNFLAVVGIYNFVRRLFNAIEGTRNQTATKK